jgi:hypothetical protein
VQRAHEPADRAVGQRRELCVEVPRVRTVTDSEFLSIVVMPSRRGRPLPSLKIQPPSFNDTPASIFSQWLSASQRVP